MAQDDLLSGAELEDNEPSDYLAELVGPGKPYADEQALAKATFHKEKHIQNIETDLEGLRNELRERVTLEEIYDKISKQERHQPAPQGRPEGVSQSPPAAVTEADIKGLLDKTLSDQRKEDQRASNLKSVQSDLQKAFGKGYANRLKDRATELGVTVEYLTELAKATPKLAIVTILGEAPRDTRSPVNPPRSSVDPSKFSTPSKGKSFSHYQDLRRKNPTLYWDPKTRLEMYNEIERQGQDFYNS